jgi:pantetheine-phosphate adenylyltransferase
VGEGEAVVAVVVEQGNSMPKQYHAVGLGGTFDHFHVGHEFFLEFAAELADEILVGVTTSKLTEHKVLADQIEPIEKRIEAVKSFLQKQQIRGKVFPLDNPYGPTLTDSQVEAVAVTEHTVSGAEAINQKRAKLGLSPLPVHVTTLLKDSHGEFISSTRIRLGEVNRQGLVYNDVLTQGLKLSSTQAAFFHNPQGPVITELKTHLSQLTILVGDIVSEYCIQRQLPFHLAVFDGKTQRQEYTSSTLEQSSVQKKITHLKNPAGQVTQEMTTWLTEFFSSAAKEDAATQQLLKIDGEEDLATVAAVLLAPLGSVIIYGQPDQGMVRLVVTEELKDRFFTALAV